MFMPSTRGEAVVVIGRRKSQFGSYSDTLHNICIFYIVIVSNNHERATFFGIVSLRIWSGFLCISNSTLDEHCHQHTNLPMVRED